MLTDSVFSVQEDQACVDPFCSGIYRFVLQSPCSCHINPPCSACVEAPLICDRCDCNLESLKDELSVLTAPGPED